MVQGSKKSAKIRVHPRPIFLTALFLGLFFLLVGPSEATYCLDYPLDYGYVCDVDVSLEVFATPEPRPDSFLPDRRFARLADNTNVYPEPSRAVPPSRNAGDGYIFVSIYAQEFVNGENWYVINPGEYVHEDDIKLAEVSDFRGVEVLRQPEHPFGWVVQEFTPSARPDGPPDERFEPLQRFDFIEVYDAEVGEDDWIWYDIGDGRWMKQIYASLVDASPRPEGVGPRDYWTEVDLYEQTFAAYEGDRMVYATLISSGLNWWPTQEGTFQVFERYVERKMSGAEGKKDYYFLEDIPYTMYFDKLMGIALHGTYWHNRFGYKHSHGCVNMPAYDAEWVYHWSEDAPDDLWVWVHTSNPHHYFEKY